MTTNVTHKLIAVLVGLLVVAVVVQSVFLAKMYRRSGAPQTRPPAESVRMDLQPKAGTGQPPAAKAPQWLPPVPAWPYGGLGVDPDLWDPLREFRSMRQQMDHMFNDSFGRFRQSTNFPSMWGGTTFSPSMDLEDKEKTYVVRMDIPGADKSDISVNIDDRQLTVSGKVDETIEEQGSKQIRRERRSGEFKRSLSLPGPVKADEMQAKYEDGVLSVTVPKAEEKQGASRNIEIK